TPANHGAKELIVAVTDGTDVLVTAFGLCPISCDVGGTTRFSLKAVTQYQSLRPSSEFRKRNSRSCEWFFPPDRWTPHSRGSSQPRPHCGQVAPTVNKIVAGSHDMLGSAMSNDAFRRL